MDISKSVIFVAIFAYSSPVTLVLALVLLGVGRRHHGALRRWLLGGGGVLAGLVVAFWGVVLVGSLWDALQQRHAAAAWQRMRTPLTQPMLADGLLLPAGMVVRPGDRPGRVATAEFQGRQRVGTLVLEGDWSHLLDDWWKGSLAEDATISGWPCRAGKVELRNDGGLKACTLSGPALRAVGIVPAGTEVSGGLAAHADSWHLRLPADGRMRVAGAGGALGPFDEVYLRTDGRVAAAKVGPAGLRMRGVALQGYVSWRYADATPADNDPASAAEPTGAVTGWTGELAEPLACESGLEELRASVQVPAVGDQVTLTRSEQHDDGQGSTSVTYASKTVRCALTPAGVPQPKMQ